MKRAVILGSYFTHFDRLWPFMNLSKRHPYIRSRCEQELVANSVPGLEVVVLELPYIFGAMPIAGCKPLWKPLVDYFQSSNTVCYMKGGTACISARTVGRAIVASVEQGAAGKYYPLSQENLTWKQLLTRLALAGNEKIKVLELPSCFIHIGLFLIIIIHHLSGKEGGLNPGYFSQLQTAYTFVDPQPSQDALGYAVSALDKAFKETLAACRD